MRIGRQALVLAAAAVLASTAGNAQLASGYSGFSSGPRQGTTEEFWFSLSRLGDCFGHTKGSQSQALLATQPSSIEEAKAVQAMLGRYTACLRHADQMRATTNLVRGAIAEGLYKRQVRVPAAAIEVPRPPAVDQETSATLVPFRVLADFSRCFAARNPDRVHRLVLETRLGTTESNAAVAALDPLASECLPPNLKIQFEPNDIRLSLVEALFKRSHETAE
jgi:hypothetical protein